jgi:quinol monooxygenase YgiN
MTNPNTSMTALVEYQVRKEEVTTSEWLDVWQKRAQDALEAEPETTGYAAAVSLDDESCLLFYEHYEQGISSLKFHMERPSHTELEETMASRRMTKRRIMSTGFLDQPGFGWRGRGGKTLILSGALVVISGLRFGDDVQRAEAIRKSQEHAEYCWNEEPETLICSLGIATRDADRGPDIKKGDVICMIVYSDMAAVEMHSQDPQRPTLGQVFAKTGLETTCTFTKMYRTTGHGFITKAV